MLYGVAICIVYVGLLTYTFVTRTWFVDPQGRGMAIDFITYWTSGFFVRANGASGIYDIAHYKAAEVAAIGHDFDGFYSWLYPPTLLLLTAPLAMAPYLAAWLIWCLAGIVFVIAALRAIVPWRLAVPLCLAAPATLWCAVVGQNGFLTAALMAGALGMLNRHPWIAGVLVGCLTYKPQFGVLFPIFLVLTGNVRAFAGAAAATLCLVALSAVVFGADVWSAFVGSLGSTSSGVLQGASAWAKLQSVYAIAFHVVGDAKAALLVHAAFCGVLLGLLVWIWTRPTASPVKCAAFVGGAYLFTPYAYVYDAPMLCVGVALLARDGLTRGFLPWDRRLLFTAWVAPASFVVLDSLAAPLGAALIVGLAARRAIGEPAPQLVAPTDHVATRTNGDRSSSATA